MKKQNSRIIVVLGMHRSGTSVIARGLQVMGVELGNKLMPPFEENNSKGFWEDLDINALNNEMLHSLKSDWHFLTPIQPSDVDTLCKNGYLLRAIELLREKTAGARVFGFKDPRVAKLLPFWKEVFVHAQLNVSYVLVIRHPLSVCQSLVKRDGFDFEKSYLLWLDHVIASLVGTVGENRVLVDYDRMIKAPEAELARIAEELQLFINMTELEKFKLEFLDQQLRHTVYQLDDLMSDETIPPLMREIYQELLNIAIDNTQLDSVMFRKKLTQWNDEFSRQRSALVLADKLTLKIYQVMGEQKQTIQALTAQVGEKEQLIKLLSVQIQELNEVKSGRVWHLIQGLRKVRSWLTAQTKKFM
jgi:O-antigen biosynthesis protein